MAVTKHMLLNYSIYFDIIFFRHDNIDAVPARDVPRVPDPSGKKSSREGADVLRDVTSARLHLFGFHYP